MVFMYMTLFFFCRKKKTIKQLHCLYPIICEATKSKKRRKKNKTELTVRSSLTKENKKKNPGKKKRQLNKNSMTSQHCTGYTQRGTKCRIRVSQNERCCRWHKQSCKSSSRGTKRSEAALQERTTEPNAKNVSDDVTFPCLNLVLLETFQNRQEIESYEDEDEPQELNQYVFITVRDKENKKVWKSCMSVVVFLKTMRNDKDYWFLCPQPIKPGSNLSEIADQLKVMSFSTRNVWVKFPIGPEGLPLIVNYTSLYSHFRKLRLRSINKVLGLKQGGKIHSKKEKELIREVKLANPLLIELETDSSRSVHIIRKDKVEKKDFNVVGDSTNHCQDSIGMTVVKSVAAISFTEQKKKK